MKRITVEYLASNCQRVVQEALWTGAAVVITKQDKKVAKIVPLVRERRVRPNPEELFGFMRGESKVVGDIVSPLFAPVEDLQTVKAELRRVKAENRVLKRRAGTVAVLPRTKSERNRT